MLVIIIKKILNINNISGILLPEKIIDINVKKNNKESIYILLEAFFTDEYGAEEEVYSQTYTVLNLNDPI